MYGLEFYLARSQETSIIVTYIHPLWSGRFMLSSVLWYGEKHIDSNPPFTLQLLPMDPRTEPHYGRDSLDYIDRPGLPHGKAWDVATALPGTSTQTAEHGMLESARVYERHTCDHPRCDDCVIFIAASKSYGNAVRTVGGTSPLPENTYYWGVLGHFATSSGTPLSLLLIPS